MGGLESFAITIIKNNRNLKGENPWRSKRREHDYFSHASAKELKRVSLAPDKLLRAKRIRLKILALQLAIIVGVAAVAIGAVFYVLSQPL